MQLIGQSPMAQQMQGAIMAHMAEHVAFKYRNMIEQQLGVQLTPPDAPLDESTEVQLSKLVAQAAQQLLQVNMTTAQQQAQEQQAQQMAMDPALQMQQAELQLRAQELQRKEADSQRDFQIAQQKLQIERDRLAVEAQKEQMRLAAAHQNAMMNNASKQQQHEQKLRADLVKHATKSQPRPAQPKQ